MEELSTEEQAVLESFESALLACSVDDVSSHERLVSKAVQSLRTNGLRAISLDGCVTGVRIDDDFLGYVIDGLVDVGIPLEALQLKNHRITSMGVEQHISRLIIMGNLKYLDLQGNDIDGRGITFLRLSSTDCPLLSLNVSYNPSIARIGGLVLADALTCNRRLQHLYLNNCGVDITTLIAIVSSISENFSLETLELDRPLLTTKQEEESDHFSRILGRSSSLVRLSLRHSAIRDFGCRLLADSFAKNQTLESVNLESNRIGVSGAEALASYLIITKGRGLISLKLSYNEIGNEGCIALAEALTTNTTLKELTMKSNKIDTALVDIGKALSVNNTLENLSLFENDFDQRSGAIFHDLIQHRLPYIGLVLDFEVYVVDGKYMIAENH